MGKNVAEFGVHLSQQVQILQMEYPGRIQQQHVEEVKWDCFYEGLSPKYWQMLAHKVNGESPVTYSQLLLATQKLERWAEARDPLPPKTTTAGSLKVICSQWQGNLFPSKELKGNCTLTAQSAAVEDLEMEEDSGPKPDEEKEIKSPAEEDAGMTGEIGDVNLSLGYIMWFANAVELYQKKNHSCFGCGSPDNLVNDCPKELGKAMRKVGFNSKEGTTKKGGWSSQKLVAAQQATPDYAPQAQKHQGKLPSWTQSPHEEDVGSGCYLP